MAKFAKDFKGATNGSPFPTDFSAGEECPEDLLEAAEACGVLEAEEKTPAKKAPAKKADPKADPKDDPKADPKDDPKA